MEQHYNSQHMTCLRLCWIHTHCSGLISENGMQMEMGWIRNGKENCSGRDCFLSLKVLLHLLVSRTGYKILLLAMSSLYACMYSSTL